ncbi:hypothetical protein M407DRAFT_240506 [Tulasnella calospora MUT 4182]|uniref:HD/PDEase domain-containing protein n=1 Tax=Tulasnella calospora MUT 4182 TaxID=1051891 RepID=A0A0C3QX98_9AGAM|nr:hypothetical protein M407DRAFT_240506 [Tulasnella calospora MUT 4182]
MERDIVQKIEEVMEEAMQKYDPSHDALHVKRVRQTALAIAKTLYPPPDMLVVEVAALMHDMADKKYVKLEEGMSLFQHFLPIFEGIRASDGTSAAALLGHDRLELVAKVVENVSWTTEKRLREAGALTPWHSDCKELHCVQDADRLDAIGAFGIMRCAAYSSATNRPLYVPEQDYASNKYPKDSSAIDHFYDKLLHIKERLKTDAGRALGEKRHQTMLNFLAAINEEASAT